MDKRILAIFDCEENYAYRLMDFMEEKKTIPFKIQVFTRADSFFPFAEKEEIECLLIAENAYKSEIEDLKIPHIIVLSENGANLNRAFCHINKYQSCENVVREIMSYYAEKVPERSGFCRVGNHRMQVIGIYTPVKRCLQTTFSFTLGQMLARHSKTLYLNFEAYSGFSRMLGREFENDISDLAYHFSCARDKLFYRMESMIENVNGLDFIPPADIYQNLMGIRGLQWIDIFEEIEKIGEYEYLLLDLSDYLMDLWEILQYCDSIYTIVGNDFLAKAKIEQYEKILEDMNYGDIIAKTKKCKIPYFKQLTIRFDELTYSELAGYIKQEILPELLGKEDYE